MKLTPRELEKLQMHCIGKLAEERKARGVKLVPTLRLLAIFALSYMNLQETARLLLN